MAVLNVNAFCGISAAVSVPVFDDSTVEVESLTMIASYSIPGATTSRSVTFLAFGPNRNLLWLRSSGQLDAPEWCPSCLAYIQGSNRDGGLTMPEGYWQSANLEGPLRRMTNVDAQRSAFPTLGLVAYTERLEGGQTATLPADKRWHRFDPKVQGRTHMIRIKAPESLEGVQSIDMTFVRTSGPSR